MMRPRRRAPKLYRDDQNSIVFVVVLVIWFTAFLIIAIFGERLLDLVW